MRQDFRQTMEDLRRAREFEVRILFSIFAMAALCVGLAIFLILSD
jgi:hypothetical protein